MVLFDTMLKISKLSDYATVIMCHLALPNQQICLSAGEIALAVHIPLPTVSKILKILLEAGLLISSRGADGGYSLSRTAEEINLMQVISAIEGSLAITECCSKHSCVLDPVCAVKQNWQVINYAVMQALNSVSIKSMLSPLVPQTIKFQGIPITSEISISQQD